MPRKASAAACGCVRRCWPRKDATDAPRATRCRRRLRQPAKSWQQNESCWNTPRNMLGLFVRKAKREKKSVIKYREFWGTKKREKLAQSLSVVKFEQQYGLANPEPFNRHS